MTDDTIAIVVLYFADIADAIGVRQDSIELPAGVTCADALDALAGRHDVIRERRAVIACAIGNTFATSDTVLKDGDELALIPPVSGG